MRLRSRIIWAGTAVVALTGLLVAGATSSTAAARGLAHRATCAAPTGQHAACLAQIDTDAAGHPLSPAAAAAAGLSFYTAADLQDAYRLPSAARGVGQTVAIVDAFDDPNAEADLAVYRQANGLPPCDTASGCFRKVDQRGGTAYPPADDGWSTEISLDVDMVSAACPNCKVLLVEADDNSFDNLGAAVDEAVRLGADAVSNSYGSSGAESGDELAVAAHYDHPGTVITASSGDWGFGVSAPAAFNSVIAVGGTALFHDSSRRGWGEAAWVGAGSGCSAYVAKASWQHDRLCGKRTVADVSAVADPNTPVAVYDTFDYPGWVGFGGTSVASPLIAAVYALAGNARTIVPGEYAYSHRSLLFDVTTGSNGSCGGSYLCTAVKGYDGPTGLGTPNGTGAF
jgi:subtilase family serine protease